MGLYFKTPINGVNWSSEEYLTILRQLWYKTPRNDEVTRERLRRSMESQLGGRVVLVNSGRSAIELALNDLARREGVGDVIVPSFVCRCVPEKIARCGFRPVLFDVDDHLVPDVDAAASLLTKDTAAVLYPYLYGRTTDISRLREACVRSGVALIEDCAAAYMLSDESGRIVGRSGHYSIFSFAVGKARNAGAGGALRIAPGIGLDLVEADLPPNSRSPLEKLNFALIYDLNRIGYILIRLSKAIGRGIAFSTGPEVQQMSALDSEIVMVQEERWKRIEAEKRRVLSQYAERFSGGPIRLPQWQSGGYLNRLFVQFPFPINAPESRERPSKACLFLKGRGIQTQLPYVPIQHLKQFADCLRDTPNSDWFYRTCIEVPTQGGLTDRQIDEVCRDVSQIAEDPRKFSLNSES